MVPKTFNTLFFIKKPKSPATGPYPIYMRITVDGNRKEFSVGRKCSPDKWNKNIGRSTGTKEEFKELNYYLDTLLHKTFEAKRKAIEDNKHITPDLIQNMILGRNEEKPKLLLEVFQEHNDRFAELIGNEVTHTTWVRYKTTKDHLANYMKTSQGVNDISVRDLNYEFVEGFEHYLKTIRFCNTNTTARYMTHFKKIIGLCIKKGFINIDPFNGFKIRKVEVKRTVLSMEELSTLANKSFAMDRLTYIRDIFLFCCYTGLAYIDIKQLKPSNIAIGIDGEDWIFTSRQKTDVDTRVPLLPPAKALVEKYKSHPNCIINNTVLPVPSNQKLNAYLKEIAETCGINKQLTSHIARHTFATTVTLSNGVPIETVSKLLGHTNIKTTQHYAKILDLKVSKDFNSLRVLLGNPQ